MCVCGKGRQKASIILCVCVGRREILLALTNTMFIFKKVMGSHYYHVCVYFWELEIECLLKTKTRSSVGHWTRALMALG